MANDLNRHECIGRLGQDIELKYLPSGEAVANISVACGKSWKDKNSGEKQERTTWINYVAFGKLAEIMGEYLHKGSRVYLSGELRTRSWELDGTKHYATEIVASQMQMLDSRGGASGSVGDSGASQGADGGQPSPQAAPGQEGLDDFDDGSDIPF